MMFGNSIKLLNKAFIAWLIFLLITNPLYSQSAPHSDTEPIAEIIYYSNLNGNVENCGCGDPPLGGLDRIISLVKEKKKNSANVLFVDGGDFCNTYPYSELNRCVLNSYTYYTPDVVALGDQEFIQGSTFITDFLNDKKSHIVASNIHMDQVGLNAFARFPVKGKNLVFLSYLDPEAFFFIQKSEELKLEQATFKDQYDSWVDKAILIVVFHGPEDALAEFCSTYPGIDIILFAHEQSRIIQSDKAPFIIGGGSDGEFLRDIFLSDNKSGIQIRTVHLPVYEEIKPDPVIQGYIKSYLEASK